MIDQKAVAVLDRSGMYGRFERNIKINYLYTALMNLNLTRTIWMLFLSYRGMSLIEIGLIESVYQLACLVFGMPAGAISDILGRKVSLILGAIANILGFALILLSNDAIGFAAGFALNAISYVLFNGSSESLTYDSCKLVKKNVSYKKVYGNLIAISFIAAAAGIAAGGFIANVSFEYVYYATLIVMVLALIPAFMFIETRGVSSDGSVKKQGVVKLFKESIRIVRTTPVILYLLVISATITIVDITIYQYCQKYFQDMSIPVYLIGIIFCADSIFAAIGAKFSYLLERFRTKDVLVLIPGVIVCSYILLAVTNNPLSVVFLYSGTIMAICFWPILSELLNSRVPSENRATVLAFKGQLSNLGIMVVFPIVGLLAERSSLTVAYLWLIASAVPLMAYAVIKIRKSVF